MAGISKTDICNYALQEVGESALLTASDLQGNANEAAIQCNLAYDRARRELLAMHPWNEAIKRASLALESATPAFGYSNQFNLPSDFISLIGTEAEFDVASQYLPSFNGYKTYSYSSQYSGRDMYKLEGGRLLYNSDVCKIIYISDLEDTSRFSSLFINCLSKLIASYISYKLTGDRTMKNNLTQEVYEMLLPRAAFNDAQQGTVERTDGPSSFMLSRG